MFHILFHTLFYIYIKRKNYISGEYFVVLAIYILQLNISVLPPIAQYKRGRDAMHIAL